MSAAQAGRRRIWGEEADARAADMGHEPSNFQVSRPGGRVKPCRRLGGRRGPLLRRMRCGFWRLGRGCRSIRPGRYLALALGRRARLPDAGSFPFACFGPPPSQDFFYIYGGEQLSEEVDKLSNECSHLCNKSRAKLEGEHDVQHTPQPCSLDSRLTVVCVPVPFPCPSCLFLNCR